MVEALNCQSPELSFTTTILPGFLAISELLMQENGTWQLKHRVHRLPRGATISQAQVAGTAASLQGSRQNLDLDEENDFVDDVLEDEDDGEEDEYVEDDDGDFDDVS